MSGTGRNQPYVGDIARVLFRAPLTWNKAAEIVLFGALKIGEV